jgi:hypothetical protein
MAKGTLNVETDEFHLVRSRQRPRHGMTVALALKRLVTA